MRTLKHWGSKASTILLGTLLHLELGFLTITSPTVLSQTYSGLQPTIVPVQPDNAQQLNRLVEQWGFVRVSCSSGVVGLAVGAAKVCVNPTPQLPAGDYIYNSQLNQIAPENSQATTAIPKFRFTNVLEYSKCLETILQLYQNPQSLSQQNLQNSCLADSYWVDGNRELFPAQALALISSANFYATNLLSTKIYPPRGQRRRVAQMFKFVYEVDVDDEEIQKLTAQS
jgi:hypothetical protein